MVGKTMRFPLRPTETYLFLFFLKDPGIQTELDGLRTEGGSKICKGLLKFIGRQIRGFLKIGPFQGFLLNHLCASY